MEIWDGYLKDGSLANIIITDCDKSSISLQEGETISYKWMNEKDFIIFVNSDEIIPTQKNRYMDYFKKIGYIV